MAGEAETKILGRANRGKKNWLGWTVYTVANLIPRRSSLRGKRGRKAKERAVFLASTMRQGSLEEGSGVLGSLLASHFCSRLESGLAQVREN